jgi:eukaryotic-like serine/threonine-protein kinase
MNREDRLAEIVTRYFQAKERGEALNPDAVLAKHPELADDLRSFFAAQSQVAKAAASLKAAYDPNLATVGAENALVLPTSVKYFGDYELLEEIARGGMGVVYKARQVSLDRVVALKMILAGQLASSADVQRFRQEAASAAHLDHPNILPIYEVGEHLGQQYFSMKMVNGGNLAAKLPELQRDVNAGIDLFIAVCEAVSFAHQRGILHRDLKPANILIDADGTPYVTDFGLAKRVEGNSNLTQSGAVVGTPSFMAPEQAKAARTISTAVDTYSLGAMLYEYLAGQPPFRGETVYETLQKVIETEPADPRSLNHLANRDLSVIAMKCLAKDPAKRYPTVAALIDDLQRFRRGEPIAARPVGRLERLKMWGRRNPKLAASLAGTYFALLAGVVALVYGLKMSERSVEAKQKLYEQSVEQEHETGRLNGLVSDSLAAEKETAYFTRINLALHEWQLNNPVRADRLLDEGETAFRGWEWAFLRRMMHGERLAITPDSRGLAVLKYSPDGRRLITAGLDNRIRLWDAATGKHLATLAGHTDLVRSITFSVDVKHLISCSAKETLAWDLDTGKPAPWNGPAAGAKTIEINSAGQVAMVLKDKQVSVYAANSNQPLFTTAGEWAAWEPTGKFLATTLDNQVILRDPKSGAEIGKLSTEGKPLLSLAISGNGLRLIATSEQNQFAWNLPTGKLILTAKNRGMDAVVTHDGKHLAVGGAREVRFWNLDTGDELPRLRGLGGHVLNLAYSPDGRSFAAATGDVMVSALQKADPDSMAAAFILALTGEMMDKQPVDLRIWDAPVPEFGTPLTSDDRAVKTFEVGPKGLVAVGRDADVELWSIPERRMLRSFPVGEGNAAAVAISPDGSTLLSGGKDQEVRTWDIGTGQARPQRFKMSKEISRIALLPDGESAAIASGNINSLVVWDYRTGKEKSVSFAESGGSPHLAVGHREPILIRSSTGGVFITNDNARRDAGRAFVIDTQTGLKVRELAATSGLVRALALSRDDRIVAALSGTKLAAESLQFIDVATGKEIAHFPGDSEIPSALAFTPDSRRLIVGTDASMKIWDTATGKLILSIPGAVGRLQFSPDGMTLVVQRENGIAIFETNPPPEVQPLPPETNTHGDPPLPMEYSPDPFPKLARDALIKVEARFNRNDLAGAMLFEIQAAELDQDPARLEHHRRSVSLYRQALPRIGDAALCVATTPLIPEKPLEQQSRSCFAPDGSIILCPMGFVARPHNVRRFDLSSGQELGTKIAVDAAFTSDARQPIAMTRKSKRLVLELALSDGKSSKRWIEQLDAETGEPAGPRIDLPALDSRENGGRKVMSVTADDRFVVVDLVLPTEQGDLVPKRTLAWELATGKEFTLPTKFHRLAFSPDGRYVLAVWTKSLAPGQPEQANIVYDLTTMQPVGEPIALPSQIARLLLSHGGRYVVASDSSSSITLRVFEVATGRCTLARRLNDNRLPFALSPNGNLVALKREREVNKGAIEIRETATGKLTQSGTTLADSPTRLQFSPDGRFVLVTLFSGNRRQLIDAAMTEPVGPPLPCASSGQHDDWAADSDALFDGDHLFFRAPWPADRYLTQTQFSRWDLQPRAVNLAEEKARAELLAGRVVSASGELAAIPLEEYRRRWRDAKAVHPDWFAANAPAEPREVPTAPIVEGQEAEKPPRPEAKPDYQSIFARHGGADRPPLVSIADALRDSTPGNRIAAFDYLAFTRPGDRLTLDLLAEGLKDSAIRNDIQNRFEQLGSKATPVVPALIEELGLQLKHDKVTKPLVRALGRIGPAAKDAVPHLHEYVASIPRNTYSDVETEAIRTLGRIGPDARSALPEILSKTPKLHDDSLVLLLRAIERVAAGHEADLAPLLVKPIETPDDEKDFWRGSPRAAYCSLIAHFGPKLHGIEPALRKLLAEPLPKEPNAENFVRVAALEALWRVTGDAEEVLPLLEAELKRKYSGWPTHSVTANGRAAAALGKIGAPAKKLLPSLEAALKTPNNLHDRIEIAEAIWRLSGKPEAFLAAAKARFEEKTPYGGLDDDKIRTIGTLGEIGPPAKELTPALLAIAKSEIDKDANQQGFKFTIIRQDEEDPDPNLRGKLLPPIRDALRKIDPAALERLENIPEK